MRAFLRIACAIGMASTACGGGSSGPPALDPPTCQPDGMLRYIHDVGGAEVTGEIASTSYAFSNKLSDTEPGYLDAGDVGGRQGTDRVYVEFERLLAKGATTAATGFFKIGTLDMGNCEMELDSEIHALPDEGWTVTLVNLRQPASCDGAEVEGSFAACLLPEPF